KFPCPLSSVHCLLSTVFCPLPPDPCPLTPVHRLPEPQRLAESRRGTATLLGAVDAEEVAVGAHDEHDLVAADPLGECAGVADGHLALARFRPRRLPASGTFGRRNDVDG